MLKCFLSLCVLLCWYVATCYHKEVASVAHLKKSNANPKYLKDFFPFLSKAELSEDMKSLLASLKRKRRVCHHGSLKRRSHVHMKPTNDGRTLHFLNQGRSYASANNPESDASRLFKRDVALDAHVEESKIATIPKESQKRQISSNQSSTEIPRSYSSTNISESTSTKSLGLEIATPPNTKLLTANEPSSPQSTNIINKRTAITEEKSSVVANLARSPIMRLPKRSNEAKVAITYPKSKLSDFDAVTQPANFPAGMVGVIKRQVHQIVSSAAPLNPEFVKVSERFIIPTVTLPKPLDKDDLNIKEHNMRAVNIAKRDNTEDHNITKSENRAKKNTKSIITKILIIPVERQIEDSDDVAKEVDVVSLKHCRENTKKLEVKRRTPPTTIPVTMNTTTEISDANTTSLPINFQDITITQVTEIITQSRTDSTSSSGVSAKVSKAIKPTSKKKMNAKIITKSTAGSPTIEASTSATSTATTPADSTSTSISMKTIKEEESSAESLS